MNSEILRSAKNKLKSFLKDKEILEVLLFGSAIKGKANPKDIDAALITKKEINPKINGMHISVISPEEFFSKIPALANTLLREGYSLKNNKFLAELLQFQNKVLFIYELKNLSASNKVKIVNILRGKASNAGMVEEYNGKWLANQVFFVPVSASYLFENFFTNNSIKYIKYYVLMH